MADNVAITAGVGTTIGADEISSVKYQRVKMIIGADGVNDGDVASGNPMPVTASALPLPTGAATAAKQLADNHNVVVTATALPTGAATSAKQLADNHNVVVTSCATHGVTGTFYQATQPVSIATMPSTPVTGTFYQATQPVSIATLPALAAGTANIGDVDVLSLPAIPAGTNNIGDVDVLSLPAIPAGTNNIGDVDVLTIPGIVGTIADDATTPGVPVMVGGSAKESDGTDPGSVSAEDDVARLITDRNRRLYVNTAHPNLWSVNEDHTTAQTNNELKTAPGASLSLYITDIIVSNGATAGIVQFVEDTGGTPVAKTGKLYLAINGGAVMNLKTPIRVTANKNFGFTSTTVTTHTITVNGYIAP